MKMLHFSGLRLGAAFPEWPERGAEIRRELRGLLSRLFAKCRSEGIGALLSAGDLFDSNVVPLEEAQTVVETIRNHPDVAFCVLPGARDPWGPTSIYRHLAGSGLLNLTVLKPGNRGACKAGEKLFFYGLPVDEGAAGPVRLSDLGRSQDEGIHVAVAYGDLGRLKPGPEEGLVMVSQEIANHVYDYLAMADGGPAEKLGNSRKPSCYAPPLGPFAKVEEGSGTGWLVEFGAGGPQVEQLELGGVVERDITIDVAGYADMSSLAQAIRRKVGKSTLAHVVLTGARTALQPLLEPTLRELCAGDLLDIRISDKTILRSPASVDYPDPALTSLWKLFSEASEEERQEWCDALKLYTAGITDPARWREAPWARS